MKQSAIIRHASDKGFENLTLAIQVWLHTYARQGIGNKISSWQKRHSRITPGEKWTSS